MSGVFQKLLPDAESVLYVLGDIAKYLAVVGMGSIMFEGSSLFIESGVASILLVVISIKVHDYLKKTGGEK